MARALASLFACLGVLVGLAAPASGAEAPPEVGVVIGFPDGTFAVEDVAAHEVQDTLDALEATPGVAWAEVDAPLRIASTESPSDPAYAQQWGPQKVRASMAWARSTGRPSVVVAVVDTGVDATVPDLAGAVLPQRDFVGDGRSGDPNGHGTGVAGVVAARGDNGVGVAGYCWSCTILPVRSLDARGSGTVSSVANGIRWAADNGADIVNLSLAGDSTSVTLDEAIDYARAKGIVVVAAAGNQVAAGQNLTVPQYPAASSGVVGVAATDTRDAVYDWSFRGSWTDVAAPGCVVTTAPGGSYRNECGTSFAAPAVAGVLALAMSAYPGASSSALTLSMLSTTSPIAPGIAARGRIDAGAMFDSLTSTYGIARVAERVAGPDRVATAVALSRRNHVSSTEVVLARSDSYADALAAAPLAARLAAPVLLTPRDGLGGDVAAEIVRLGATRAWLIGGDAALGPAVESGLLAAGATEVTRLAGTSRYDTARLIAERLGATSAFAVAASSWADAVAASALAAQTGSAIVLVDRHAVPSATAAALSGITDITVVGGPGVIADSVLQELGATGAVVRRVAGATRYETSRALAEVAASAGADRSRIWVATGVDWPDALAAGPAAAGDGGVLLLVDGRDPAAALPVGPGQVVVVGGLASLSAEVVDALLVPPPS